MVANGQNNGRPKFRIVASGIVREMSDRIQPLRRRMGNLLRAARPNADLESKLDLRARKAAAQVEASISGLSKLTAEGFRLQQTRQGTGTLSTRLDTKLSQARFKDFLR